MRELRSQEIQKQIESEKARLRESGTELLHWMREDLAMDQIAEKHPWLLAALSAGLAAAIAGSVGYWRGKESER